MTNQLFETTDKRDVRILWNTDKDGRISEIDIGLFFHDVHPDSWPMHLHDKYGKSIGNNCTDWKKQSLLEVVIHFYILYGFQDKDIAFNFFKSLVRITEFKQEFDALPVEMQRMIFPGWF